MHTGAGEMLRGLDLVAAAVADVAYRTGLAATPRPDDLLAIVTSQMYEPRYVDHAHVTPASLRA
jgi:hypothetical protein